MKAMSKIVIALLIAVFSTPCVASEVNYQPTFCKSVGGSLNRHIAHIRIDCVTYDYVIEIEDAKVWTRAIGPALYASVLTGKKPGVALVIYDKRDEELFIRLQEVALKFDIKVWKFYGGALGHFDEIMRQQGYRPSR